jgi:hypothetical protein
MECGDQVLRNFLNGLVIHLRGTKENPKNPNEVLAQHKAEIPVKANFASRAEFKPSPKTDPKKAYGNPKSSGVKKATNPKSREKKPVAKVQVVEKVKFNNGKNKKS